MSQEKVELVRRAFEAYASGGVEAVVPFYTPDVVWLLADLWCRVLIAVLVSLSLVRVAIHAAGSFSLVSPGTLAIAGPRM